MKLGMLVPAALDQDQKCCLMFGFVCFVLFYMVNLKFNVSKHMKRDITKRL